jgi:uncharacterized OB-fold protein
MSNKCPKCGSTLVYVGVTSIECGEHPSCANWTAKQAAEVERMSKKETKKAPEPEASGYSIPLPELDLEEDETNPLFPVPTF